MWTLKAKGSKKDLQVIRKRFRTLKVDFTLSEDKQIKKAEKPKTVRKPKKEQ